MQSKGYVQRERNLEYDICNMWCSKPISVLQDYCAAIKVHIFWPLLFQNENSSILLQTQPRVEPRGSQAPEMSLKKLQHIELMEEIVDLIKRVVNDPFFIGSLLRIGYKIENKILTMEEALNWVKYTGDMTILPKLGAIDNCWPMLSLFFTEYKYHITKVVTENYDLLEDFRTQSCPECIEQGEVMKLKGNEAFSKERFDMAIIYYTRAIEYSPENHLLYGNRALCFLCTGQFRNALGDGKRATILKSSWTKGHYRYCDALSMLGELDWALQANIKAQKLCRNDPEGIKDLIQQELKLQKQIEDLQGQTLTRNPIKASYKSRAYVSTLSAPAFRASLNFADSGKDSRKTNPRMASGGYHNMRMGNDSLKPNDCGCHPDFGQASGQTSKHKGKQKSRNNELEKLSASNSQTTLPMDLKNILEKQFSKSSRDAHQDFANIMKMLRSLIQDGYTALMEQRCQNAAQAFTDLLNGLDPQKIKQLNLTMINYVLVIYGLAISLLGIGQPEELSEAENQFKRMIEHYPSEGLDCLAYCGIGKVYLKKNRFLEALNHFEKARTLICRLPRVLTWPTSNVVIEETRPGKIKLLLEKFIEECKFPPVPDAICCYQQCRGYSKIQIYVTDPDFKGFIRISCCQYCKIEFHMNCWKKLKTTTFNDKIDKDFLQGICLTPDCEGIISKIIIYSSSGQVKCEFEHKVIKEKVSPRPILKQKCSSLEKLKLKEDKKLKRKIQKKEAKKLAQERMEEDLRESNPPKQEEKKETTNKAQKCQFLDDRILQCIKQYSEKIKSGIQNPTKLLKELLSWKVLSTEDYTTCFSSRNFVNEAVDYVIRHLVQENNRVKTRIFLHVLSELKEVEPKLATWIQKLNGFGLDATGPFLLRYGASLKELDFSIMTFLWNEKYGHKLASIEGKQLDYFCEPASSEEARYLIWLLEEHREKFPALHNALDEFFDVMDSRCTVLRKQDSGDVPLSSPKIKHKGKKRKLKDSKPILVGSGAASVTTNNDTVNSGEDHKSTSSSLGPFVVPEHLRQDVEEFEALYEQHNSSEYVVHNKKLLDVNPKQKGSTLYDYFSQLLEKHSPLDMSNKMFSEEYEFFPEETRQILEKVGDLKTFLLACPRFELIDNCIALKKVTSRHKKKRKKKNIKVKVEEITAKSGEYLRAELPLNPAAREFKPDVKPKSRAPASAPAAIKPPRAAPANASPPKPAPEVAPKPKSPKAASGPASGSLPEAAPPKVGVSPESPLPSAEDPGHQHVSCPSMQGSEAVMPTYWAQPQMVTGYCTYLPYQGYGIAQMPPTYINVITSMPTYANVCAPVAGAVPTEYPMLRPVPMVPVFMANAAAEKTAAPCVEGPPLNAQGIPTDMAACKTQTLARPAMPPCSTEGPVRTPGGSSEETGPKEELASKCQEVDFPPTKVAATQISWVMVNKEINTEPYGPFEAKLGEISQLVKEYQILQQQLQEASNSYEQKKLQSSEETKDLEEKLTRNMEENKISKTELNWFLQDLEKEIKKWEQEKKEIQDKLKALKKKMKMFLTSSDTLTEENAEIDDNDQDQESFLDEAPETSCTFTEEKAQVEDCIKKGKDSYEETLHRAVSAEVSVLETWKETEMYKLQVMESQAEAYLKNLKLMRSDSAAYPDIESDIQSWESFLSDVRKETEKAKDQFEEQIKGIKNGSRLSDLSKVQISELSFPASHRMNPQLTTKSLGPEDQAPAPAMRPGTEDQAAAPQEFCVASASDGFAEASPTADEAGIDLTAQAEVSPGGPEPEQMMQPGQFLTSVVEQLLVVFPCFSSSQLTEFIEEVQNRDMMALLGWSTEEIVQRVTKLILEEQDLSDPEDDWPPESASASAMATVTSDPEDCPSLQLEPRLEPMSMGQRTRVLVSIICEICHEVFNNSKTMRVLKCGYKFHKECFRRWLQEQSACPMCLELNLISEE
ncbi:LOW QUALITY PROTEIN: E3 ubiquitin-protein ligase TTC3-like [Suncus etruscus]|uniref:LOW QUALITY PROTEIN: E3 ubiquitin-protein ligase TTC3-like n=1 Tax=Suncus etruscus TaxID=109475 RepID=UPI00211032D2|nr:LOW QUALITY PROTEIN: E3 ubiquitin-protein ligase TTC3-like [Suncus etruscus]